jgi:hypothetical protein
MSQIDVAKANMGRGPVSPAERQFAGFVQPGQNNFPLPGAVPVAPKPRELHAQDVQQRPRHRRSPAVASVATIQPADLEPISSQGPDKLLHSLSRIDLVLGELLEDELSEGGSQAFSIGKAMIRETIRRLRLMQSGQAYVMMGR